MYTHAPSGMENPPKERERERELLWFVQLEAANMNIWMGVRAYTDCWGLYTNTRGRKIYKIYIHNDPRAKSSSGAVYQWKRISVGFSFFFCVACVGVFSLWRQRRSSRTSGKIKRNNNAPFPAPMKGAEFIFRWKNKFDGILYFLIFSMFNSFRYWMTSALNTTASTLLGADLLKITIQCISFVHEP